MNENTVDRNETRNTPVWESAAPFYQIQVGDNSIIICQFKEVKFSLGNRNNLVKHYIMEVLKYGLQENNGVVWSSPIQGETYKIEQELSDLDGNSAIKITHEEKNYIDRLFIQQSLPASDDINLSPEANPTPEAQPTQPVQPALLINPSLFQVKDSNVFQENHNIEAASIGASSPLAKSLKDMSSVFPIESSRLITNSIIKDGHGLLSTFEAQKAELFIMEYFKQLTQKREQEVQPGNLYIMEFSPSEKILVTPIQLENDTIIIYQFKIPGMESRITQNSALNMISTDILQKVVINEIQRGESEDADKLYLLVEKEIAGTTMSMANILTSEVFKIITSFGSDSLENEEEVKISLSMLDKNWDQVLFAHIFKGVHDHNLMIELFKRLDLENIDPQGFIKKISKNKTGLFYEFINQLPEWIQDENSSN